MIQLRSVLFNILFYTSFIALMVFGSPLLMWRHTTLKVVRMWAHTSVWLLATICGTRIEFRNMHLIPKGASIIACKHQSFLETFALITVLDDFSYILKKELLAIPFFGWYLRASEQIAIDRAKRGGAMAALRASVRDTLTAGRQVIIFPEGTRTPVGAAPSYKAGVAALCSESQVPCTPVALDTGLFWPRRSYIRRPGTVVIEFLPPICTGLPRKIFMTALENAIEPATDALVARALKDNPALENVGPREHRATA